MSLPVREWKDRNNNHRLPSGTTVLFAFYTLSLLRLAGISARVEMTKTFKEKINWKKIHLKISGMGWTASGSRTNELGQQNFGGSTLPIQVRRTTGWTVKNVLR